MKAGKSYWIHHLRLLFTHKNRDFGAFAKTNGNHTAAKPSQPMAPAQCSMCVNNLFQLCATAVHTKLDTKNYSLKCEHYFKALIGVICSKNTAESISVHHNAALKEGLHIKNSLNI